MKQYSNRARISPELLARAAEDAAFAALDAYRRAERELALPAHRPAPAIHAEVLRAQRVAVSLAEAVGTGR